MQQREQFVVLATIPVLVTRGGAVFAHLEMPSSQEVHATKVVGADQALDATDIVFGTVSVLGETLQERLDVDGDQAVTAMDALAIINALNMRQTPSLTGRFLPRGALSNPISPAKDTNRDTRFSPSDVLLVVNHLNSETHSANTVSAVHERVFDDASARLLIREDDDSGLREIELIPRQEWDVLLGSGRQTEDSDAQR